MKLDAPLIGVTADLAQDGKGQPGNGIVRRTYHRWLTAAGAAVVSLVPGTDADQVCAHVQGVVLSGGRDIPPDMYGAAPHPATRCLARERVEFELQVARAALSRDQPVLGICNGLQLLNVAGGGSLFQHIPACVPNPLQHAQEDGQPIPWHAVRLDAASRLAAHMGPVDTVNSDHHQAVDQLAAGYRAVMHAPDGVIEAIEHPQYRFAVGVQWHPELMTGHDGAQRLANAFVTACADYGE